MSEEGFFSRWARRKSEVRSGRPPEEEAPAPAAAPVPARGATPPASRAALAAPAADAELRPGEAAGAGTAASAAPEAEVPLPSMADVARLTRDSDYSAFMRRGVDENVKRAAMKKLFTDPHYNVMDGLDIYIDDYSKPDPIPMAMLRKMKQSQLLGLFRDEERDDKEKAAAVSNATDDAVPTDDRAGADMSQSRAPDDADESLAAASPGDTAAPNAEVAAEDGTPTAADAPPGATDPARPAS